MIRIKRLSFGVLALLLFVATAFAQKPYPISDLTKSKIDSTYTAWVKKYRAVGVSLAIVEGDSLIYAAGYGYANKEQLVPASENTIYRIGSITKSFTALSLLQLQEKGLVDLNASIKTYLPDLTISSRFNDSNEFLLSDMLSHVSGLPCDLDNGDFCTQPPDIKWVIGELNKQTTISPKRYHHAYSNVAFGLMGEVIARKSNSTYSAYVRQHIFLPLGMKSSFIDYDSSLATHFAKGYYRGTLLREPLIRDQAAGLIHSNVLDMSKYIRMLMQSGKGLDISSSSILEMQKDRNADIVFGSGYEWGYGLYSTRGMIKHGKDSQIVHLTGHGGDTYAYHADMLFIPERNIGVILLTNSDNGRNIIDADNLLKLYLKYEKSDTLRVGYKEPADTLIRKAAGEFAYSGPGIHGTYNLGPLIADVQNEKLIVLHQGPVSVKLTRRTDDSLRYDMKAKVFSLIPVSLDGQELQFVKIGENIYMKSIYTKSNGVDYFAIRQDQKAIPASWMQKIGNYQVVGPVYGCRGCRIADTEGMRMQVILKDGHLQMILKGKSPDTRKMRFLSVINEELCVTGGIGRGTGETVKILPNGHIYYSGFEFQKR